MNIETVDTRIKLFGVVFTVSLQVFFDFPEGSTSTSIHEYGILELQFIIYLFLQYNRQFRISAEGRNETTKLKTRHTGQFRIIIDLIGNSLISLEVYVSDVTDTRLNVYNIPGFVSIGCVRFQSKVNYVLYKFEHIRTANRLVRCG